MLWHCRQLCRLALHRLAKQAGWYSDMLLPFLLLHGLQSAISSAADNQRPKVFVSSSAVGYYGASSTSSFTEDSPAGSDYLAEICKGELDCWWRARGVFRAAGV